MKLTSLVAALISYTLLAFPYSAGATPYTITGTVDILMAQDSSLGANGDWFTLNGVGPQGVCPAGYGSEMGISIKDDQNGSRQYALVMAAWMAGATISVRVDDTQKNSTGVGLCYAQIIW